MTATKPNPHVSNEEIAEIVKQKLKAKGRYVYKTEIVPNASAPTAETRHPVNVTDDESLALYVDEVVQAVKNYCMIPKIYWAMRYIVADICVDYVIYDQEMGKDADDINPDEAMDPSDLASVKIGDVTVGFGDKYRSNQRKTNLNAHDPTNGVDGFVLDYKTQLNRFRRIW